MTALLASGAACKREDPQRELTARQRAKDAERPAAPAPDQAGAVERDGQERAAAYQRCWGLFNVKQWDALESCYAVDVESEAIDAGPVLRGVDAAVRQARRFAGAFPDATGEPQLVLVSDRTVQSITLVRGTHLGVLRLPTGDVTPTGESIGVLVAHGVELDDLGRATREWSVYDAAGLLGQLGQLPGILPIRTAERRWPARIVVVARHDDREARNLTAYRTAPPARPAGVRDLDAEAAQTWAAGDYVVARGRMSGLPKGRPVSIGYLEVVRFDGDELGASWLFYNGLALAQQRGLLDEPAPGRGKSKGKSKGKAPRRGKPAR